MMVVTAIVIGGDVDVSFLSLLLSQSPQFAAGHVARTNTPWGQALWQAGETEEDTDSPAGYRCLH